jgi:hypothetical protein
MTAPALDRDTILRAIRTWPQDEQLAFAQEILRQVRGHVVEEPLAPPDFRGLAGLISNGQTPPTDEETVRPQERSTWDALYGIASNSKEPPSDEEVAKWLDEHRMEKYGG